MSYLFLQYYWWAVGSLLCGLLVFLMFVQGGQTLIYTLAKDDDSRSILINALGRKWEFTFTTLVVFGGTMFAAFPLFYSASFGGGYWLWMIFLFCFIIQAVSYEFRMKAGNIYGHKTFEWFLMINGTLGPFLAGVIVATFYSGAAFSLSQYHTVIWHTSLRGLEALIQPFNLVLGVTVLLLSRTLALLYFANNIRNDKISAEIKKHLWINGLLFVIFFLLFIAWLMFRDGYIVDINTAGISMVPYKYFWNLIQLPAVLIIFLSGVILVLTGIILTLFFDSIQGIWYSGTGTVLAVCALVLIAGWMNTPFYPSTSDMQSSLTIFNASSSHYTLKTMFYVSLFIPVVFAYIFYAWRAINNKPIDSDELKTKDIHKY